MSLIIERLKEKQAMANREPDDLTVQNMIDKLYELVDTGKVNPNARIIINNDMWCVWMCSKCGVVSEKHYKDTILKFEIHEENSTQNTLELFTIMKKR